MLTGPMPTPAVAYLAQSMRADAGVVISASHNPYADNGIKLFGPDGFKLPDAAEAEIEALMDDPRLLTGRRTEGGVGRAEKIEDARGRYVTFVKSTFPRHLRLDGLRVVVDGAHGAAYRVAPLVFAELGAHVTAIGVKPNGKNINDHHGALHPETVAAEVVKRRAHLGIALDGDADRLIVVDEQGNVVDGDAIMSICAQRMLEAGTLAGNTVVATVMSNLGLERALAARGVSLLRTAVGDRYVVEAMRGPGVQFRRRAVGAPGVSRPRDDGRRAHRRDAGGGRAGHRGQAHERARGGGDATRAAGAAQRHAQDAAAAGADAGHDARGARRGEHARRGGEGARALVGHRAQAPGDA
jgi:phosphoglucosamine mutase